jgi:hypothetical protein
MKPHLSRSTFTLVLSLLALVAAGFKWFTSGNLNLIVLPILALGGLLTIYLYLRGLKG